METMSKTMNRRYAKIILIYISVVVVFFILGMNFWIIDSPKDEIISIEVKYGRIEKRDSSSSASIIPVWYYALHSSDGEYRFYLCGDTSAFNKDAFDANVLKNDTLELKVSKNQYEKNDKTKVGISTFAIQKDGVNYLDYDYSGVNTERDINTLWIGIIFFIIAGIGWAFGLIYFFILFRQGKLFGNNPS